MELQLYNYKSGRIPDLGKLPDPRLFATHVPFVALPRSVVATPGCKVVYVCRDPKDTFVSLWHFMNKLRANKGMEPLSVEFAAEQFCAGVSPRGPYWEHVLGYWLAHPPRAAREGALLQLRGDAEGPRGARPEACRIRWPPVRCRRGQHRGRHR